MATEDDWFVMRDPIAQLANTVEAIVHLDPPHRPTGNDLVETVTRIGLDNSMTVKLDSGKTAEVSPAKARHIDYGYAVDSLKSTRAERVIGTGNGLTQQDFQIGSSKADLALYTSSPQQEFSAAKEIATPETALPAKQQHDFGIGF